MLFIILALLEKTCVAMLIADVDSVEAALEFGDFVLPTEDYARVEIAEAMEHHKVIVVALEGGEVGVTYVDRLDCVMSVSRLLEAFRCGSPFLTFSLMDIGVKNLFKDCLNVANRPRSEG